MTNTPPSRAAMSVLVVDDSKSTCESVKAILEDGGFSVFTHNSPFGFIKMVRERQTGIILIDVGLGTMNGTKLVRLARDHSPANTKILLYSGRAVAELERDVKESGADGYISKDISSAELVRAVKNWASLVW